MDRKVKIAVLVSGGGTNLQALIDAQKMGIIRSGEIVAVISSKVGAYALERAKNAGIYAATVSRKDAPSFEAFESGIIAELENCGAEVIILAGFMSILSESFTKRYANRIINVHPALIPSFCGKGYYGLKVHEEALEKGVKVSGATVHLVNEVCDGGEILAQRAVAVKEGDTPETLQKRIMEQAEWKLLPEAAEKLCCRILREGRAKPPVPSVTLKKLTLDDKAALCYVCNNIDRSWLSDRLDPYTEDDAEQFINRCAELEAKRLGVYRMIVADGKIVGNISVEIKGSSLYAKTGEIGYFIAAEYQNRGIMTEAVRQICEIAFNELDILRIAGNVFEPNMASRRVLENAGFELEGILKNGLYKNGKAYSDCIYGLTK